MMHYKKRLTIALLLITLLSLTVSCSQKKEPKTKDFDVQKLADQLLEDLALDSLVKAEESIIFNLYPLEKDDIDTYVVYVSSGATTEEIALFKASDEDKAKDVMASIQTRISDQKESYSTYRPEELTRLDDSVLVQRGQYIILCISDNRDKALEVIDDYIQ